MGNKYYIVSIIYLKKIITNICPSNYMFCVNQEIRFPFLRLGIYISCKKMPNVPILNRYLLTYNLVVKNGISMFSENFHCQKE